MAGRNGLKLSRDYFLSIDFQLFVGVDLILVTEYSPFPHSSTKCRVPNRPSASPFGPAVKYR